VGGQQQRRILVVEDDFFVSDLVVNYLSEQGYAVDLATSARALGRHLEHQAPDLILLDIMLPGMDGSEIGHLLRVNPATARIPIVVVSADRRIARKAASIQADAWIAKPFDLEVLRAKIEEVLAAHSAPPAPDEE
jgi:DNA-binding response OmpR family regulator